MRILIGLLTLVAVITHAEDHYRTFTAKDGRTLNAKIIQYDAHADKLQIERQDKKKITVPSIAFSEKDQAYIKKWHIAQVFLSGTQFKIDVEREEVTSSKKEHEVDMSEGFGGSRRSGIQTVAIDKNTQYKYTLLIDNQSDLSLQNVTMEYRIYYKQQMPVKDAKANKNRQEKDPRPEQYMAVDQDKVKDGKVRIEPIEPHSESELSTDSVTLLKRSSNRPWGDKVDLKSDLSGAWIKLTMRGPEGEILVREVASSSSIMKKFLWDAPQEN